MVDWLLCWAGIADVIGSCIAAEIGPKSLQKKDGVARHSFFESDTSCPACFPILHALLSAISAYLLAQPQEQ